MRRMITKNGVIDAVNEGIESGEIEVGGGLPEFSDADTGRVLTVVEDAETGDPVASWEDAGGDSPFKIIEGSDIVDRSSNTHSYTIHSYNQSSGRYPSSAIIFSGQEPASYTNILRDYFANKNTSGHSQMLLINPGSRNSNNSTIGVPGGTGIFIGPATEGQANFDCIRSNASIILTYSSGWNSGKTCELTNSILLQPNYLTVRSSYAGGQVSGSILSLGSDAVLPSYLYNAIAVGAGLQFTNTNDQALYNLAIFGRYNDYSGISATQGEGDRLQVGVGASNSARANCFATGNDGTEDYIKVGDTKITESQLQALLALLNQ